MRFVTFTHNGKTRAGVLTDSGDIADLGVPILELLDNGGLIAGGQQALTGPTIPIAEATIEAPVPNPRKVLAVGLNYRDHAEEASQPIPQRPIIFSKTPGCIVGPGHAIYMPRHSVAVDWEAELCIVIGKKARYVSAADAAQYIAGYCVGNDISVRDWQFHAPTWIMGKSFDTHGPIGPWLVTPDEIDVGNLAIQLWVNGEQKQSSNTNQLIFGIGEIIEYISSGITLDPGDIIFTGTPAGVGGTKRPPEFLKIGDTVRVEIAGLGSLENPVTADLSS